MMMKKGLRKESKANICRKISVRDEPSKYFQRRRGSMPEQILSNVHENVEENNERLGEDTSKSKRTNSLPNEADDGHFYKYKGRTGSLPEPSDIECVRNNVLAKKNRKLSIRNFGDITARIRRQSLVNLKLSSPSSPSDEEEKISPTRSPLLKESAFHAPLTSYAEESSAEQEESDESRPDNVSKRQTDASKRLTDVKDLAPDIILTVSEAPSEHVVVREHTTVRQGRRRKDTARPIAAHHIVRSTSTEDEETRRIMLKSNINRLDTPVEEKKRAKSPSLRRRLSRFTLSNQSAASALKSAVTNQDYETLQKLLSNTDGSCDINYMYPPGVSILHQASILGDFQTVKLLVEKGADVNLYTWSNLSPLMLATTCGHFDVAQLLLLAGANVDDIKNGHQEILMIE